MADIEKHSQFREDQQAGLKARQKAADPVICITDRDALHLCKLFVHDLILLHFAEIKNFFERKSEITGCFIGRYQRGSIFFNLDRGNLLPGGSYGSGFPR